MGILSENFINEYKTKKVNWGFKSGPNSLGEITYRRSYSRDGEQWWETVLRVVEGTYLILRKHCEENNLPFDEDLASFDAQEMYDRIFNFKFLPPGRGLFSHNTETMWKLGSMCLNNCSFVSTRDINIDLTKPFEFLMDVSMLGVGVGFDVKGAGKVSWGGISQETRSYVVPDSREGWVESTAHLMRWAFGMEQYKPLFDYSQIRPAGSKVNGFGGICPGSKPLSDLHEKIFYLEQKNNGEKMTETDIADIMNLIGVAVVSGGIRRTAEIAFGDANSVEFQNLKNYELNPERAEWGWASNNSVFAEVGMDYEPFVQRIIDNGEPGFFWLENAQKYGRMIESVNNKDWRILGTNPCGEISLEPYEICNLVETFPNHCDDVEDFKKTIKYAFIYAKATTLLPTHWKETNAVMMRNRRIGTSVSGVVQFIENHNKREMAHWLSEGYKTVCHYDRVYSEWLGIRESVKKTTVKPSGTVSLLAGATPGGHYPTYRYYIRRIRFNQDHPDLKALADAGYEIEDAVYEPLTKIVNFPVIGDENVETEKDVTIGEKMSTAVMLQKYWSDNQVSYTVTFDPETEGRFIPDLLTAYETQLKSISFLPYPEESSYVQMPYEAISKEQYLEMIKNIREISWDTSIHDIDDNFCDGGACVINL